LRNVKIAKNNQNSLWLLKLIISNMNLSV